MILGLFKKHCITCGVDVKKEEVLKRFGKYFCSEKHAEEYREKLATDQTKTASHGGGCCGK